MTKEEALKKAEVLLLLVCNGNPEVSLKLLSTADEHKSECYYRSLSNLIGYCEELKKGLKNEI